MCGRYTVYSNFKEVQKLFGIKQGVDYPLSYNVAPSQTNPIILLSEGDRILTTMRWSFVSWWDKRKKPGKHTNARAESVAEKRSFKEAFLKQRCLIVANGFFEWKEPSKPFYFSLNDNAPICFAGIWEKRIENNKEINSYCIITTAANDVVMPIHDRMPVIISPQNFNNWLSTENQNMSEVKQLLHPFSGATLTAFPVSRQMNKANFNSIECIKPFEKE